MERSLLQQHLDETRADLRRAEKLFGTAPIAPPENIVPDEHVVKKWLH
ncbi:hypothetical protein [Mycolicibacterium llatzerense]|nr:hypothetical protein [Mycolicibacterium llatzerense]